MARIAAARSSLALEPEVLWIISTCQWKDQENMYTLNHIFMHSDTSVHVPNAIHLQIVVYLVYVNK